VKAKVILMSAIALLGLMVTGTQAKASSVTLYNEQDQALFTFEIPDHPLNFNADDYEGYDTSIHLTSDGLLVDMKDDYFVGFDMDREKAYVNGFSHDYTNNAQTNETSGFRFGVSAGFRF
jgi:hypothetical protein